MKYLVRAAIAAILTGLSIGGCSESPKAPCRLLQYNIADGMWYDQFDNYDRFVGWMQRQQVDVAAFCETATHWNAEQQSLPTDDSTRYLPAHLQELSSRWGHPYVALGAFQDNYPVAVTSRFEPELIHPLAAIRSRTERFT